MDTKIVFDLLDVKEKQSLAFCHIFKEKMSYEDLQKAIDNYSFNMAESVLERCKQVVADEKNRKEIKKKLCSLGADKEHSGKRVHEAFYKQIIDLEQKKEKDFSK